MAAKGYIPSSAEPAKAPSESVFHTRYRGWLLSPEEDPDDPWYRGDIYEDRLAPWARDWAREMKDDPYLNKVRVSSRFFPDLKFLASWKEVSTAVSRHRYMYMHPRERAERARRVRVTQLDLRQGETPTKREFRGKESLENALLAAHDISDVRICVVEDLSRDVVEVLGSQLQVDPHFFRYQVSDFMWDSLAEDAVERKHLDFVLKKVFVPYISVPPSTLLSRHCDIRESHTRSCVFQCSQRTG